MKDLRGELKEILETYGGVCGRYGIVKGCKDEINQLETLFKNTLDTVIGNPEVVEHLQKDKDKIIRNTLRLRQRNRLDKLKGK